jgi:hypothetical protein
MATPSAVLIMQDECAAKAFGVERRAHRRPATPSKNATWADGDRASDHARLTDDDFMAKFG